MKKVLFLLCLCAAFYGATVAAEEKSFIATEVIAPVAAGMITSHIVHEVGHLAVAEICGGGNVRWTSWPRTDYGEGISAGTERFWCASAGFASQQVGAELILLGEPTPFRGGYLLKNFLSAAFCRRGGNENYNDYGNMAKNSHLSEGSWQWIITAKTAFDLWRFYRKFPPSPALPIRIRISQDRAEINLPQLELLGMRSAFSVNRDKEIFLQWAKKF